MNIRKAHLLTISLIVLTSAYNASSATIITLITPDSENMEDTNDRHDQPTTNFGTSNNILISADDVASGPIAKIYMKWNISSVPTGQIITNATLRLNISGNFLDAGEAVNYSIYAFRDHQCSGADWIETCLTYNTRPNSTTAEINNAVLDSAIVDLNDGAGTVITWNVTAGVAWAYANGDNNVSLLINGSIANGTPIGNDRIVFQSKESADRRPILEITYDTDPCACSASGKTWQVTDHCQITSTCNIGTGILNITDTGWINCTGGIYINASKATIYPRDAEEPFRFRGYNGCRLRVAP